MEEQTAFLREVDLPGAAEHEFFGLPDVLHELTDAVDVHGFRVLAGKTQDDGLVGGVTDAGQGQRTVDIGLHAGDAVEEALFLE